MPALYLDNPHLVAPFTGAWIETHFHIPYNQFCQSHPSRVRGLKLLDQGGDLHRPTGRTLHGCVD